MKTFSVAFRFGFVVRLRPSINVTKRKSYLIACLRHDKSQQVTPLSNAYLANNAFATVGQGLCVAFFTKQREYPSR